MEPTSPSQLRRAQIETLKVDAGRLRDAARQQPIKDLVGLAMRDLDEGLLWLRQENIDSRPYILQIVDMTILMATTRMNVVSRALALYGPDATLIG
jgi:hypothetical protein